MYWYLDTESPMMRTCLFLKHSRASAVVNRRNWQLLKWYVYIPDCSGTQKPASPLCKLRHLGNCSMISILSFGVEIGVVKRVGNIMNEYDDPRPHLVFRLARNSECLSFRAAALLISRKLELLILS
mmetsp:Transcript_25247/g.39626  ORF Transcript_25247/g.39626 Transcript_25247/m.39626 type:complete len:126 (-) Transcript_25247:1580-1957(-)